MHLKSDLPTPVRFPKTAGLITGEYKTHPTASILHQAVQLAALAQQIRGKYPVVGHDPGRFGGNVVFFRHNGAPPGVIYLSRSILSFSGRGRAAFFLPKQVGQAQNGCLWCT
jgi:hypothetical protein